MHLRFLFFQPSSHFSLDTHAKQLFHLDEEGFLWLRFCFFGPWSNSFDLCRTLHALNVISSCILCFLHFFICNVSVLSENSMMLKKVFNALNSLSMCISGSHYSNPRLTSRETLIPNNCFDWMWKVSYDWVFAPLVIDLILSIFVRPFMH